VECVLLTPLAVLHSFQPRLHLFLVTVGVVGNAVARAALELYEVILRHRGTK